MRPSTCSMNRRPWPMESSRSTEFGFWHDKISKKNSMINNWNKESRCVGEKWQRRTCFVRHWIIRALTRNVIDELWGWLRTIKPSFKPRTKVQVGRNSIETKRTDPTVNKQFQGEQRSFYRFDRRISLLQLSSIDRALVGIDVPRREDGHQLLSRTNTTREEETVFIEPKQQIRENERWTVSRRIGGNDWSSLIRQTSWKSNRTETFADSQPRENIRSIVARQNSTELESTIQSAQVDRNQRWSRRFARMNWFRQWVEDRSELNCETRTNEIFIDNCSTIRLNLFHRSTRGKSWP